MSKHLTLTDRAIIEKYLAQDMSFSFIAKRLNRSATTISCEIKNHRCFVNGFRYTSNDCINYRSCLRRNICDQESIYTCFHRCKTCTEFDCKSLCSQYISAHCPLLDKPPYVCTRCPNEKTCKRNHAYYTAHRAHAEYVKELSSSRKGIRTSPERLLELNDLLMPLVNKGQSINHIFATHSDEIRIREKRTIYAKSLVTLRQKEDELVRDQMDGLNVYVAGSADVNFLFDRYISTKTELRSTTKANYLYTWDHFIRDTFGKKKIKDVKYSDVLFFYTDLITNKGLQVNTLESINTVLRPTFELAVRDDIIRRNPVNGAYAEVKKRNGGARKSRRALTVEQQREFIDYVAKNPFFFHWYPFFVFLLGTGCRIGEAIGIRWDDVDMKKRTININHSLTCYTRSDNSFKCEFRVSEPKTEAGIRTIPMMGPVYEVLKSEYQRQQEEGFCVAEVDGMTNFIFTNRFGNPHNPQAVNRAIKRIIDTHNAEEEVEAKKKKREPIMLPRFSCHIFRHTFASRFCENETNVKVIQEVMGHADVSTTMNIYAEANPEVTREALEKLAKNMDVF